MQPTLYYYIAYPVPPYMAYPVPLYTAYPVPLYAAYPILLSQPTLHLFPSLPCTTI